MEEEKCGSDEEFFECETNNFQQNKKDNKLADNAEKTTADPNLATEIPVNDIEQENTETPGVNDKVKDADPEVEEMTEAIEKTCLDEEFEEGLTEEEKEDLKKESLEFKKDGNEQFKQQKYTEAHDLYTRGLQRCPKCFKIERSVLFSNRAACYKNMDKNKEAIKDCSEAIALNPKYVRVLLRRAQLYEDTEKLDEALGDYKSVIEIDPSVQQAREACMRLPQQINERNEKMKEEMMGKLKELGNMVLKPFGLSTNNFQMQQNPETGSYNVQFVQNTQQPK
uniref:Tetratricopeptide repeat protein 1 n=1 Tax=Phallusia mammillata TaxID=59560 RepID=A0A6F9DWC6_9ASCI|nr:tetratricopeptide repeat protein 1-like [Phallusia mammillata]